MAKRFNHWQHRFLKLCSKEGDEGIERWNRWRVKHSKKDILLEGADLHGSYLNRAYLYTGSPYYPVEMKLPELYGEVHLERANLQKSNLRDSHLDLANLEGAKLEWAHLENAHMWRANLVGANLYKAHLEGTDAVRVIVDGSTSLWKCEINDKTRFDGVGLGDVSIHPRTKTLLQHTIRRIHWEEWYEYKDWYKWEPKQKRYNYSQFLLRNTVGRFWEISDYGISTKRVIITFLGLALFFAAIYSNLACWFRPGAVSNLEVEAHLPLWHYGMLVFLRPIYFSVVTMTTLGFGDMYANAQSIWGHILLTIQVILGYVLMGALITRFAVLFTAGGPAGKFADE